MKKLKVLDLFSGIGGFSLGLERAGMETVAFCEIDPAARKVLKKHWPDVPIFKDVEKLKVHECDMGDIKIIEDGQPIDKGFTIEASIDVVCGGFPCQDISVAGFKKGFKDEEIILQDLEREFIELFENGSATVDGERNMEKLFRKIARAGKNTTAKRTRSGLWEEFKRIIGEVKPRYAIIENVANLRNEGLSKIVQDLWALGYACEWHIISARSVGAPHLRQRLWIIAYPFSSTLWEQSGRLIGSKREGAPLPRVDGETKIATNSSGERLQGSGEYPLSPSNKKKIGQRKTVDAVNDSWPNNETANPNGFRFWQPFASEKEKQEWWTKTALSVSHWEEIRTVICGVDDGIPSGLLTTEKERQARLKQLGNSILPQIPEIIGREIVRYESRK